MGKEEVPASYDNDVFALLRAYKKDPASR